MARNPNISCYFDEFPGEKPEIVTCNECGFFLEPGTCRYHLCPFASPEDCKDCEYIEYLERDGKKVGRCFIPGSMMERYVKNKGVV